MLHFIIKSRLTVHLLTYLHGNKSCVTASDIMTEVNPSSGQTQDVGEVLGYVLYHALHGRCFISQPPPDESFFLDYIMARLGSENFTVEGKRSAQTLCAHACGSQIINGAETRSLSCHLHLCYVELATFMRTLNIGLDSEEDHEHDHEHNPSGRENSSWAQVRKTENTDTSEASTCSNILSTSHQQNASLVHFHFLSSHSELFLS